MGVLEAIGGFFAGAGQAIAGGAKAVLSAIKSVYLFASSVFDHVGGAWDWMVNGIGWLGNNVIGGLARVLHLLEWLALHAIPEGLTWVLGQAVGWARRAVHDLSGWAKAAVAALSHFLLGVVHTLEHWARNAIADVWHTLTQAWHFIETIGKRVADLVLHPDRLVAWILGALVLPLVRFMLEASAPILRWLIAGFEREAVAFASVLESVLARLI